MTESPIYERLASGDPLNPLAKNRRALIVDDTVVTTPVTAEIARAIRDVERRYFHAAADALAPFGLHPYDIAAPAYERIVYRDELNAGPMDQRRTGANTVSDSILDDQAYKASIERLEEAVRAHHRLLEDWGNAHDVNDDGTTDNTVVVGWVLTIGQVGYNDGREFHGAVVEHPGTLNSFMALGLADYGVRFLRSQTNDYSTMEE